jgi:hypothetical protein
MELEDFLNRMEAEDKGLFQGVILP